MAKTSIIKQYKKQIIISRPNTFYNSFWVNKFINKFIKNGRKNVVQKQVYSAFSQLQKLTHENPGILLLKSIDVLKPTIGTVKHIKKFGKKRRKSKIILVPVPLTPRRQIILALSWLVDLIIYQKQVRHKHIHKNIFDREIKRKNSRNLQEKKPNIKIKKKKGYGRSRKKTLYDRFYITLPHQNLNKLIIKKFQQIYTSRFSLLYKRKYKFYSIAVKNRAFLRYRWA